jgi:predicted acyl esterase
VPSTNHGAVVAVPGASSSRSSVLRQAAVLARHGYGVLLLDPRGQGRSEGRAMNLGWWGDRDVAAAVDWLRDQSGVDPDRVGALGESMGGEEAIGALAADRRLRAVVAEGATNRVAGDLSWLSDAYGVRGWFQERVNRVTTALTDLLTEAPRPVTLRTAVAAAAPRPVLLIAAGEVQDEIRAAEAMREASPGSIGVWVVDGAGHTGGLTAEPAEWERRVVGFFDAALLGQVNSEQQEVQ